MTLFLSTRFVLRLALILGALLTLSSCNDQAKTGTDLAANGRSSLKADSASKLQPQPEPLYLGQDWEQQGRSRGGASNAAGSGTPANRATVAENTAARATSMWTLVLGTFSSDDHQVAANQMLSNLPQVAPQVRGATVHTTPRGSMVIFGSYTGRDDPAAKRDQDWLKTIKYQDRTVFNRVILTRLDLRLTQGQLHPHDLLSARRAYPEVDPLYTLDIAIWMADPDAKSAKDRVTYEQVKQKAEAYAAELRSRGEESYFYHDDVTQWSVVTVGLFNSKAIDSRSGLYNADVDALIRRFPVRLANGEPLMEFKNRLAPKQGTRAVVPRLVLVPRM